MQGALDKVSRTEISCIPPQNAHRNLSVFVQAARRLSKSDDVSKQ
jgi:hypothetical protein